MISHIIKFRLIHMTSLTPARLFVTIAISRDQ